MIPSAFRQDDCKSGAEALARARAGHARRVASYERQPVAPPPAPPVEKPKPEPLPPMRSLPAPRTAVPPMPDETLDKDAPLRVLIAEIVDVTAAHFGIDPREILSPSRVWPVLLPRQIVMHLAHHVAGRSLPAIGRVIHRDHTSILFGARKIKLAIEAGDAKIGAAVQDIRASLEAISATRPLPIQEPPGDAPNVGKIYSKEDEATLYRLYITEGRPAHEVARIMGRKEDGIARKLQKLFLRNGKRREARKRAAK